MTAEFGPLEDAQGSGIRWQTSGWLLEQFVGGVQRVWDMGISYSAAQNRLSLHGESERPGDPFRAGALAVIVPLTLILILTCGMFSMYMLTDAIRGTVLNLAASVLFVASVAGAAVGMFGLVDRIMSMEVYDHTTPKPDDRIEELADNYLDGELDREAFEKEVETVFEREGRP
jgi:hypothetical protein